MLATTKKRPVEAGTPPTPATLADHPDWRAAEQKKGELQAKQTAIVARCREAEGIPQETPPQSRIKSLVAGLLGKPETPAPSGEPLDAAALAEERTAIDRAIASHAREMTQLRNALAEEIYHRHYEAEHRVKRADVARAIAVLFDRWVALKRYEAETLTPAGALIDRAALGFNTASCPQIIAVLKTARPGDFRRDNQNLLDT